MNRGLVAIVAAMATMAAAGADEPVKAPNPAPRRVGRGVLAGRIGADNITLRLPNVIGDNMVLQRNVPLPIWGWAAPGQQVRVALAGGAAETTADEKGEWMVTLPAMPAGGPHQMTVAAPRVPTITVKNILVGEVWFSSGQSNMDVGVAGAQGGAEAVAAADWPDVRLFQAPHVARATPASDVAAEWRPCSPTSVPNFSAIAYYFGRELHKELKIPIGLINCSWGSTTVQQWTPPEGYDLVPEFASGKLKRERCPIGKDGCGGMYNAMIAPVVPFAIRGALWYQGEDNIHREGPIYDKLLQALILGWRDVWGQGEFSVYYVQLAPFAGTRGALPAMWEAQTRAMAIPKTGMAVISDLVTDLNDIHPANKLDVGKRLAGWALAKDYGRKDLVYSGPTFKGMTVEGNKALVSFDHTGGGLASRDNKDLTSFQVAGEDKKFLPATARIVGEKVEVFAEGVKPVAVRFAYDGTARPNLMNKEGLPANSFRTDGW
ncbi:MAG: sialate O-acetylesterase [Planctomycetota bacterium]|nr:sialate O-acetylesterase [Planctomycetota bacterium]